MAKRKVFIVHGHDHRSRDEVVRMVASWGLEPLVLAKAIDEGATIIEKFEANARKAEFAIIVLTPDDHFASSLPAADAYRARQNVIFEMGWFYAKLGRSRTLLVHKGDVELPSDVTGVLYKRFVDSPAEIEEKIAAALSAGGLPIERSRRTP